MFSLQNIKLTVSSAGNRICLTNITTESEKSHSYGLDRLFVLSNLNRDPNFFIIYRSIFPGGLLIARAGVAPPQTQPV